MQGMATYTHKIYSKIPKEIINLGRLFGGKVLTFSRLMTFIYVVPHC
jgi:cephalosporin hydroxylase